MLPDRRMKLSGVVCSGKDTPLFSIPDMPTMVYCPFGSSEVNKLSVAVCVCCITHSFSVLKTNNDSGKLIFALSTLLKSSCSLLFFSSGWPSLLSSTLYSPQENSQMALHNNIRHSRICEIDIVLR